MPWTLLAEMATPAIATPESAKPSTNTHIEKKRTHASATDEDAAVSLALSNHLGCLDGNVGISRVVVGWHANIFDRLDIGVLVQVGNDLVLVFSASTVASEDNSPGWGHV